MKLILPIAGVGLRLRPFTFSKPKAFLKIGGKLVVDHILSKISTSLTNKVPMAAIVGYKSNQIQSYLQTNFTENFDVSYVEQTPSGYQGDVPYFGGLGHAILLTRSWHEESTGSVQENLQNDDTLIFLADMIPVRDYDFIIQQLNDPSIDGIIGTMEVEPDKTQFYGIVEADSNGKISSLVEKPKKTSSNHAISGVYAFKAKTMKRLYEILQEQYDDFLKTKTDERMEFQFTPALQNLVDEGFQLQNANFDDGILDFGRPNALLAGNRILLDAHQCNINGAINQISSTVINNPCSVGKGSKISNSVIGPYTSIGESCIIENCILSSVVIGDSCILKNIISHDSIFGDYVSIDSVIKNNMILGDHTFVVENKNQ